MKTSVSAPATVPDEVAGIQVNSCEKPGCFNFGVPPVLVRPWSAKSEPSEGPGVYGIRRSKQLVALRCGRCHSETAIKSNKAIIEEMDRLTAYLKPKDDPARHSPDCVHREARFYGDPDVFRYNGTTPAGKTERYECKGCRRTFAVHPSPILRQKTSHINKWFFKLLMHRVPFRQICELLEIDMPSFVRKIDFIHRQCMAFAGDRERRLLEGIFLVNGRRKPRNIYVAVDWQEYSVSWRTPWSAPGDDNASGDERVHLGNIVLDAVASADMKTGYVFGMHLNFDPDIDTDSVIKEGLSKDGDQEKPPGYREFERVWRETDYLERLAVRRRSRTNARFAAGFPQLPEPVPCGGKLPDHGMPVREEYTMYAHLFLLKRMFSGIDRIRFFMDCETSIRAACHAAFANEIKEGRFEGFFINNHRSATESLRLKAHNAAVAKLKNFLLAYPDKSPQEARLLMLREAMRNMVVSGYHKDRCLLHPFPDRDEPWKEVCHFNDTGRYDAGEDERNHLAWLYGKASLRAIDRFFTQFRRRVSLVDCPPVAYASFGRPRVDHSLYTPLMLQKVAEIFRVFYNYVELSPVSPRRRSTGAFNTLHSRSAGPDLPVPVGEEDPDAESQPDVAAVKGPTRNKGWKSATTPAMCFGLAKAPVRYEDILYFRP